MYCKNCGNQLNSEENFCNKCGVKQIPDSPVSKLDKAKQIPKRILYAVISLIVFVGASIIASYLTQEGISAISNKSQGGTQLTYSVMKEITEEINKELPRMIDEETRLDSVIGMENSITYKYTLVNLSIEDLKGVSIKDEMGKSAVNLVCTSPEMEIYRTNKATVSYSYYDKDSVFIEKITVDTGTDCL